MEVNFNANDLMLILLNDERDDIHEIYQVDKQEFKKFIKLKENYDYKNWPYVLRKKLCQIRRYKFKLEEEEELEKYK